MTRLVRASEIGTFAFCERAWGYAARGETSERELEIMAGRRVHALRLGRVSSSLTIRRIGYACVTVAVGALVIALLT